MKKGLRISFFGSSLVSAYWNGAATYYRGIIKELHKHGHRITFYEPDVYDRQKHRDIENPPYAESIVYQPNVNDLDRCLKLARQSDVIVKTSGIGIFDDYLEEKVLQLKKHDNQILFWDVDAPATLDRIKENRDDPFRKLISQFDYIFTYGGGHPVVNAYLKFGAKKCIPIYNALDPSTHYPVDKEKKFEAVLGFMGNRLPDRESRVLDYFFSAAKLLPDKNFLLGGSGWDSNAPDIKNVKKIGHIYTSEHNAFYCSTIATLNINRQSMADYGFSPPTRIFEAAGAGACIICDYWEGIEQFLSPGKECLVAKSGSEVAKLIKDISSSDAKKIGNAAYQRVISEHTYMQRAQEIDKYIYS